MENIFKFYLLLIAVMGLSFVSCGDDDSSDEEKKTEEEINKMESDKDKLPHSDNSIIVGMWRLDQTNGYELYTFNSDGSGSIREYSTKTSSWYGETLTFKYDASKESLTIVTEHPEKTKTYTASIDNSQLKVGNFVWQKASEAEIVQKEAFANCLKFFGSWNVTYPDKSISSIIEFKGLGFCVINDYENGELLQTYDAGYRFRDKSIIIYTSDINSDEMPYAYGGHTILDITDNTFVLKSVEGDQLIGTK